MHGGMPLFTKHRDKIYADNGEAIVPTDLEVGERVDGFSNVQGKPNRKPQTFEVTQGLGGKKRFTLKGLFGE